MKKKITKIVLLTGMAVVIGICCVNISQKKAVLSDLMLSNVEALAGGEGGASTETTWSCKGTDGSCQAKCGLCGTSIGKSSGFLTGSHKCSL